MDKHNKSLKVSKYTAEEQKALNHVFTLTMIMSFLMIFFSLRLHYNLVGYITLSLDVLLYPILSYLAKKGNFNVLKILLIIFLIERTFIIGNLIIHFNVNTFFVPLVISMIYVYFFYGAYKVYKAQKNRA